MWGGGSGMGPRIREDNGRGGGRAVREQPLPDGCQTGGRDGSPPPVFTGAGSRREDKRVSRRGSGRGARFREQASLRYQNGCGTGGRDGSPPPVFTGAGSRREDNGGEGERAVREQAPTRWLSDGWEGWVPAPRLHGGRISTRGQRGEGG